MRTLEERELIHQRVVHGALKATMLRRTNRDYLLYFPPPVFASEAMKAPSWNRYVFRFDILSHAHTRKGGRSSVAGRPLSA